MTDTLLNAAGWIAITCAIGAIALVAVLGWRMWQDWQRLQLTRRAAVAFVDVHAQRLEESIAQADEQVGALADGGERLAESLGQLRGDVDHLRWLLGQVPQHRSGLRRAIGDILLPTEERRERASDGE